MPLDYVLSDAQTKGKEVVVLVGPRRGQATWIASFRHPRNIHGANSLSRWLKASFSGRSILETGIAAALRETVVSIAPCRRGWGTRILTAWNRSQLRGGDFLTRLAGRVHLRVPHAQFLLLRDQLEPLRGRRRFESVEDVVAWIHATLSSAAGPKDVSHYSAEYLEMALGPPDPNEPVDGKEPGLAPALSGPVGIAVVPGELDPTAVEELGGFGRGLQAALLDLRAAQLTAVEAKFVALRTVGGLTVEEAGERLRMKAEEALEIWSRLAVKLVRELPETARRPDTPSTLVTFALAETVLLERLLRTPVLLSALSWRDFERALSATLERIGFEIELQRGTKDGGIDILALKRADTFGVHRYLVQAKRYTQNVGVSVVRELLFLHSHHRVTKSCLASTSSFTSGAWQLAKEYEWQLELRDRDRLLEWIRLAIHR